MSAKQSAGALRDGESDEKSLTVARSAIAVVRSVSLGLLSVSYRLGVISILNHSQLRLPTSNVCEGDVQTSIACTGMYQMRLGVICFPEENPVGSSLTYPLKCI
jgi:hypothetical protein